MLDIYKINNKCNKYTQQRILSLSLYFQFHFTKDKSLIQKDRLNLISKYNNLKDKIDNLIQSLLTHKNILHLRIIDKAIIQLCITELLEAYTNHEEIIRTWVYIAYRFSDKQSALFINGIISSASKKINSNTEVI